MQYGNLGRSGLVVSRISLGSWLTMGNAIEQATSDALIRRAVELGINLLDTADVYNIGEGEKALGAAISGLRREDLVIASKCFFPMSDGVNDRGLSRKHIHESVRGSLARLGLDYLDLYQCHRHDPQTPVEETAMAMDDLIRRGLVLYWGVSYWPARLIVQAVQFCRDHCLHAPISNQPPYNLLSRDLEAEVMAASAQVGVSQIVFSPLAQGVLSGKYGDGQRPADARASDGRANRFIGRYLRADCIERTQQLVALAERIGESPSKVALAWCLRRPEVASVIVGARTLAQLEENVAAVDLTLSDEITSELDRIFPGPALRDTDT